MASKKELEALIILAGKIDPSLQNAINDFNRKQTELGKKAEKTGKLSSKAFSITSKAIKMAGVAAGAAVLYFGKQSLELASDIKEAQNVIDVTFGTKSPIDSWVQTALKGYGLSELAAKKYTGTLGAMLKSSGLSQDAIVRMSTDLAGLAGDFASFYNLETDEAFEKIRSGISGETEPLKQLGINMSVANMQAYALSKGIKGNYSSMDQATQTALRYSYLMSVSADAQGDFARTQGSFANQTKLLKTNLQQLGAKVMTAALPSMEKLLQLANKIMDGLFGNPEKVQKFQDIISGISSYLAEKLMPAFFDLLESVGPVLEDLMPIIKAVGGLIGDTLITAIQLATEFLKGLHKIIQKISDLLDKLEDNDIHAVSGYQPEKTKVSSFRNHAFGGFTNKPAIFGDAGREVAIPIKYKSPRSLQLFNQTAREIGAETGGGGTQIIVTYAPVVTGAADGSVQAELQESFEKFKAWIEDYFESKRRESFAG